MKEKPSLDWSQITQQGHFSEEEAPENKHTYLPTTAFWTDGENPTSWEVPRGGGA